MASTSQRSNREDPARRAPATTPAAGAERIFAGSGEMAALMRAMDWAKTPLGPVETWSPSLRMMVSFLLVNRFPLLLWWGPEFLQFYNDAYRPVLGTKHPRYLGRSVRECWSEVWDVIGPLIETPFNGGPATWSEDLFLELYRHGFTEEAHFTIAYSPVPDDTAPNGIGGVLATVHEISEKVVGERRVVALRDLGARSTEAKTAEEACQIAAETLAHHPKDIPFALLYLIAPDGTQAHLAAATGVAMGTAISPDVIALDPEPGADLGAGTGEGKLWPLAAVMRTEAVQVVEDLASRFDHAVPQGPWSDPPRSAVVAPIRSNIAHQLAGLLVTGVSSRLRFDDAYAGFFELVSSQIATAIANARAYEEERRRAEALAAIDRAKTAFFSNVSHEFRTPLTLMLGPLSDALVDTAEPLPSGQHERLAMMQRNGLRLLKLVNTLLDFARIEAGRVQAVYEPTDLAASTVELASTFRSLAEKAGMQLIVDCPPLGEPIYVDRDMWEKIVLNLLSNAFKFTLEGSITVALHLTPRPPSQGGKGEDDAPMVELEVRDTGTGIAADELPRLFERFHRVEGARARTHEGSGIGLALVQELVHLHGGTIRAESAEGVGTTFFVRLPLGTAHLPPEAISASRTQASTALGAAAFVEEAERWLPDGPSDGGDGAMTAAVLASQDVSQHARPASDRPARIVLADDNADMRDYLRRLLGERYSVEAVANGRAALAAIERALPDLVLADVMMPELDGFGLLQALRSDRRTATLPVILLSARAGEEATIEGLAAGADDYLVKPFSAREVLGRVAARLEIAQTQREALERARELETTFEALTDAVFVYDRQGRIIRTNTAARKLYGLDRLPDYETGLPRERAAQIQARDEEGRPIPAEESGLYRLLRGEILAGADALDVRVRHPDGRELEVNISGTPLRDAAGTIIGAIAIARDVTERRALERRTAEALEALLAMAEAMVGPGSPFPDSSGLPLNGQPDGQPALTITMERLASLCCRVLGSERVAIIGLDGETELLRPIALTGASAEQERQWRAGMARTRLTDRFGTKTSARLRAGESVLVEVDHLRSDDPARVLSNQCFLLVPMFADGVLAGYFGVNFGDQPRDYTAEGIARAKAVARLVGMVIERERLERDREQARANELVLREATRRMDEFLGIASHELRTPLTTITANVQMAERHLRAFVGDARTAQEDSLSSPSEPDRTRLERTHLLLERTERQVVRLDRLVGDLLDASRIQADKLELLRETVDLASIVREAVEAQRAAWPGRSIALDLPRSGEIVVSADADRIGQVLTNYLTNALKYSPADQPVAVRVHLGGTPSTRPSSIRRAESASLAGADGRTSAPPPLPYPPLAGEVPAERWEGGEETSSPNANPSRSSAPPPPGEGAGGEVVRVAVTDRGPGLTAEQQARLFERFYRAPGIVQQSGSGVGLGLGLYISKTIVERHGGAVSVASAPGEGSTFAFTLPLAPARHA